MPASPTAVAHSLAGSTAAAFWLDDVRGRRVDHEPLAGDVEADLVIVGAGYTGLWTALRAVERQPGLRVVLLEAERVGWAASGRNGGFCEASLTHGDENGRSRWPDEIDTLTRLGLENLDDIEATVRRYRMDVDFERTGMLAVAVEPHQVPWIAGPDADDGHDVFLDESAVRAEIASPTYLAGRWDRRTNAILHPAKLALELARVIVEAGVVVHERTPVRRIDDAGSRVEVVTDRGVVRADRAVLATNVFPSLLKRNRLMTVPVYDYVLMTEPLGDDRLAELGWRNRQGVSDLANQFHYYRLSADGRILFGGYDAVYHAGRKVRPEYEERPETFERLASHFLTTFPQLEGVRFTHRWAGAIDASTQVLRLLRPRPRRQGGVRLGLHGARRRCGALRGRRDARPARRTRDGAHVARDGRGPALAVPARAGRVDRHQPDPLVARPSRPPAGSPQRAAEDARRPRARVRLVGRAPARRSRPGPGITRGCRRASSRPSGRPRSRW